MRSFTKLVFSTFPPHFNFSALFYSNYFHPHVSMCVCVQSRGVCVCVCTDPRARRLKLCILQHGQKWKQLNLFFLLLNINPSTFSTRRSSDPKRNAVKSAASTDERHPDGLKGASQSLQRLPVTTDSQWPSRVISVCDSRVSLENKLLQRNVRIMCWSSKSEIRWQLVWITSDARTVQNMWRHPSVSEEPLLKLSVVAPDVSAVPDSTELPANPQNGQKGGA